MRFNHHSALSFTVGALLTVTSVVVPAAMANADTPELPAGVEQMLTYNAADFVAEASALPPELVDAVIRDLGVSGEQYLAEAAAATQAPDVVESLSAAGIDVLGSRMEGTKLIVNVADSADEVVVTSAGATAEVGEPAPFDLGDKDLSFAADIYGGQGYYYEAANNTAYRCTIGFNGFSSGGAKEFLTAGHCTDTVRGSVFSLKMDAPNTIGTPEAQLGFPVPGTTALDTLGNDIGRISVPAGVNAVPSVLTWGGGSSAPLASAPLQITGRAAATVGASVCKSGSTTGWTCGSVLEVDYDANVEGHIVNSIVTSACTQGGDSGGSVVIGTMAVGITSWSVDPASASCLDPNYAAGAFPMDSAAGKASVARIYGSSWQLAVSLSAPVITSSSSQTKFGSIVGTVSAPTPGSVVEVYLDGSPTYFSRVSVASGQFSISLQDVRAGTHRLVVLHRAGGNTSVLIRAVLTVSDESDRLFVQQVYRDFLNREASTAEQSSWMSKLAAGTTTYLGISKALSLSDEWVSTIISGYYRDTLQREPDRGGLDYWTTMARSGYPMSLIAAAFYSSSEYFASIGESNNRVWVSDLYRKLLLREPDSGGVAYWVSTIESGVSRGVVAHGFYQSFETLGVRVNVIFQKLLNRTGDRASVAYWSGIVAQQGDLVLAAAVAGSAEYYTKAQIAH